MNRQLASMGATLAANLESTSTHFSDYLPSPSPHKDRLILHAVTELEVTKLSSAAGAMYKIRKFLPLKARKLVYNSLAGSYLQYGIAAWGHCSSTMMNKLQALQNKIVRYMTYSPPQSNVDAHYQSLSNSCTLFMVECLLHFKTTFTLSITLITQEQEPMLDITFRFQEQREVKSH